MCWFKLEGELPASICLRGICRRGLRTTDTPPLKPRPPGEYVLLVFVQASTFSPSAVVEDDKRFQPSASRTSSVANPGNVCFRVVFRRIHDNLLLTTLGVSGLSPNVLSISDSLSVFP